ncbi:MAG: hypothetical protein B5M53_01425 [Candidatus Cloacimonas sp. 4484_209]|nr:MAG: hypothetical protein B5M53_01425 [Candidatus Cloacimonas sp. 4484_209]
MQKENRKIISKKLQPLDLLFLLRPPMLIPVWTFFLAGYWRANSRFGAHLVIFAKENLFPNSNFWISFVSYSLLLGSIYIVNQIVDRETDRLNNKLFLIPLKIVSVRLAVILSILFFAISFFIIIRFNVLYLIFYFLSLFIGLCYSLPPMRFKGRAIIDIISNAIGYGVLAFGIGWFTSKDFSLKLILFSLPYFFATASVFAISTILDEKGDRKDGAHTTAVKFGSATTRRIGFFSLILSLISAIFLKDVLMIITATLSLPLAYFAMIKEDRKFLTLFMRGGSYILIILIGLLFPWYLILLVFIYIISKFYYRYRFGINYPELLEKDKDS